MDDSNLYESPTTTEIASGVRAGSPAPMRATVAAFLGAFSFLGFISNNPFWIRDGIWLQHLLDAFSWFAGAIGLPIYALILPKRSRLAFWVALGTLAAIACFPDSWRYLVRVFTQLMPFS